MNRTEYYNLGLPEGADVFNPLSPFNENMEAIAEQMHTNEVKTIGQATELKSDTVHSITRVTPDSTFFSFTATSDFNAGDVFTVDGIQVTAKTPTGEALGTGAYVINSQVLCVLVGTLMTVFTSTGKVALASDSEKLGGELPEHYGTAQDVATAVQTAQNANTISLANQQSIIEIQEKINLTFSNNVDRLIGTIDDKPLYERYIGANNVSINNKTYIATDINQNNVECIYNMSAGLKIAGNAIWTPWYSSSNNARFRMDAGGLFIEANNITLTGYGVHIIYTKG